ncbi:hypothetical protein PR048_003672 [Dryococelus australis]|uniref:Uncharacterized protein n=1 Tax=Dryococelus australis TaxID=614101 RepID=A0ABQ9IPA7_9NEOP|nr:hypothetical protein PR048_003672 [Dryococelus australis]
MPLVGGFSRRSPVSPALAFLRCSILTSFHPHWHSRTPLLQYSFRDIPPPHANKASPSPENYTARRIRAHSCNRDFRPTLIPVAVRPRLGLDVLNNDTSPSSLHFLGCTTPSPSAPKCAPSHVCWGLSNMRVSLRLCPNSPEMLVRLLASRQGEPCSITGGHVGIVSDDATGQRVFSGISRFPILTPHSPHYTLIGPHNFAGLSSRAPGTQARKTPPDGRPTALEMNSK